MKAILCFVILVPTGTGKMDRCARRHQTRQQLRSNQSLFPKIIDRLRRLPLLKCLHAMSAGGETRQTSSYIFCSRREVPCRLRRLLPTRLYTTT